MIDRFARTVSLAALSLCACAPVQPSLREPPTEPPPQVSCSAWAIADGVTGELLAGMHADLVLDAASTTKIMCALVVLELAERDPRVLDETVTFSQLADDTSGSTAAVRAGESLPVRECLYGLLLPSGNDAGNALAEHFDARLAPPDEATAATEADSRGTSRATRARFIAEMNRHAKRLGLAHTTYSSPYGDGRRSDPRTTTAHDLVRLAWHAMQNPRFREYVRTREHACEVATPDGGTRKVEWTNTNQLLGEDGYDGVKTGTNESGGACLVSSCRRGGRHLLAVVLGSTTREGRYVDTKALYEWALRVAAAREAGS